MGTLQSWRKAYAALKDSTTVGVAKVNSKFKDLDIAIVKVTNHVECPPKERHVRNICCHICELPRADVAYCIYALARRLAKTSNCMSSMETNNSTGIQDMMDWRGNPIKKDRHGGVRAACFITFMVVMTNISFIAILMNLVTYLHGTMHMDVASSATTVTNFVGATCGFALLGAFISDSWITRFKTILIFAPFEILGYGVLALQAHLPSLHPPACNTSGQWTGCEKIHGFDSAVLYTGLYSVAIGEGCLRSCLASLGGDQFDSDDLIESHLQSSFFNLFTFGIGLGVVTSLLLVVWIDNNKGWDYGFGLSAIVILVAVLVLVCGLSLFRNQKPNGSPLTRMMQVFVAAFSKRELSPMGNLDWLRKIEDKEDMEGMEVLPHTKGLRFLDKAAIDNGDTKPWSFCSITQVEETKIILRLVPIFVSSMFGYVSNQLLLTLTVQQGSTMNTKLGKIHIAPASLFIIPATFQMVMLVIYDRLIVPFARRITGHARGITHLQRIGIGFVSTTLATVVAALVERKRKGVIEENGLQDSGAVIPMSLFWLTMQFFLIGVADVTSFVGLLEFFNGEVPRGMKSIGTAIFWCVLGLASLMGSVVIEVVNRATRHGEKGVGWLEGNNLNESQLDNFYWLLSGFGLVAFLNYLYWAKRYVYRRNPGIDNS